MPKFMALYIGSISAEEKADYVPSPEEQEMWSKGMTAWGEWMASHSEVIVDQGSPLGKTLRASKDGIATTENRIVGYVIVEAADHESASRLFRDHPHFAIMPGDSIEILECLSMPDQS